MKKTAGILIAAMLLSLAACAAPLNDVTPQKELAQTGAPAASQSPEPAPSEKPAKIDFSKEQSFLATVLEETAEQMIVEPAEGEIERELSERVTVRYPTSHLDYLYGLGRQVVIYYTGVDETASDFTVVTDDISTEGFRDFTLSVTVSPGSGKRSVQLGEEPTGQIPEDPFLYYYDVEQVQVTVDGQTLSLEEALAAGKLTLDALVARANQDVEQGLAKEEMFKDGGSILYEYPDYHMIKYHTLDGDRDVYIGSTEMDISIGTWDELKCR